MELTGDTLLKEPVKQGFADSDIVAEQFLGHALKSASLAHAYLFKGKDMTQLYKTALLLGKVLNCTDRLQADTACGNCQNCRWIENNAHPAVMTLSRLTQLDDDSIKKVKAQKGKPLTQIPTGQVSALIGQLGLSSPYFRVVIFTEVEEVPASPKNTLIPPAEWKNEPKNEKKDFKINPLNRKVLNIHSSNKMLKTLEEPYPKTLFIFLVDSEEGVLETIESRCQTLAFQSAPNIEADQLSLEQEQFFQGLLQELALKGDFYAVLERFRETLIKEAKLTEAQALDRLQRFLHQGFSALPSVDKESFALYSKRQQCIEKAKRMLKASTNAEQVLNQTFYELAKGF